METTDTRLMPLDDVIAELEPSLELVEAELVGLEVDMGITSTCLCTIRCGGIKDLKSL